MEYLLLHSCSNIFIFRRLVSSIILCPMSLTDDLVEWLVADKKAKLKVFVFVMKAEHFARCVRSGGP